MGVWSGFYTYPKKKSYKQACVCFLIGDLPHLSLSVTLITYTAAHQVSNRCCLTLQLLPNSIILPVCFQVTLPACFTMASKLGQFTPATSEGEERRREQNSDERSRPLRWCGCKSAGLELDATYFQSIWQCDSFLLCSPTDCKVRTRAEPGDVCTQSAYTWILALTHTPLELSPHVSRGWKRVRIRAACSKVRPCVCVKATAVIQWQVEERDTRMMFTAVLNTRSDIFSVCLMLQWDFYPHPWVFSQRGQRRADSCTVYLQTQKHEFIKYQINV